VAYLCHLAVPQEQLSGLRPEQANRSTLPSQFSCSLPGSCIAAITRKRDNLEMIGRPESSEAGPYYFTYINQVDGDNPLRVIEDQLDEALSVFGGISDKKSLHRYAPEKWSIRQTLNHVTDTERSFAFRALWFARGFDTPLPSYDQNIAAAGAAADEIPWAAHVEEFGHVRRATIALFRNMPADAWIRSGIASDNRFTVRAMAFITAGHLTHHLKILRERYL
jgi:DinB superfamily